jgi:hypothetical protein
MIQEVNPGSPAPSRSNNLACRVTTARPHHFRASHAKAKSHPGMHCGSELGPVAWRSAPPVIPGALLCRAPDRNVGRRCYSLPPAPIHSVRGSRDLAYPKLPESARYSHDRVRLPLSPRRAPRPPAPPGFSCVRSSPSSQTHASVGRDLLLTIGRQGALHLRQDRGRRRTR